MMPPKRAASGSPQDGWHESNKYIDVYFDRSNRRWVAWVREPRVGGGHVFIGSQLTEKVAARCRDRALLKLEMDSSMTLPFRLNFGREDYQEDEHLRNTLTTEDFIDMLLQESRQSDNKQIADELAASSELDLALLADLTVWHRMPYLPAYRLIQLNCARWPVWCPNNIKRIAEARRDDDSRDWYFPVIVKKERPRGRHEVSEGRTWWWSGIWHSAAEHAESERVHALPPLAQSAQLHLPHDEWIFGDILAASGGLLLIKAVQRPVPLRRNQVRSCRSRPTPNVVRYRIPSLQLVRLLVCNPLTKECRALPSVADSAVNGPGGDLWYPEWDILACLHRVQTHMVADDEANTYKVILTFQTVVCVYKSSCNSWACLRFPAPRPWESRSGIAHVSGRRLYFADVDTALRVRIAGTAPILHAAPAGDLRLFEVEASDDAGRWSLLHTYPLQKFHIPFLTGGPGWNYDIGISQFVELVECMEGLYAVIPARLDEVLTTGPTQTRRWRWQVLALKDDEIGEAELECMPLVFYIMQLQPELQGAGVDGVDHGVLRIQIPKTRSDIRSRRRSLYKKADPHYVWNWRTWFRCTARKSVIWVACEDYLLQYDVVSWESKTQIIPVNEIDDETLRFSYTPSFHMKP